MKYTHLLPFLDSKELKDLAYKIINEEVKGVKIITLYPFLDRETMDDIVEKLIETKNIKGLKHSLPFITKDSINKIHEKIKSGELEGLKESYLIPFMGQSKIKEMFSELIKRAGNENEDLEDEVDDLEDELDDLEDELDELDDLKDEFDELKSEKDELSKEKEKLMKEIENLKKQVKK